MVTVTLTTSPALSVLFCKPVALVIETLLTVGAVVSITRLCAPDATLVLPAASVAVAVTLYAP
jgi:hypothetical protein